MSGHQVGGSGGASSSDKQAPSARLQVMVKGQDEHEVLFKIKNTTRMDKVMNAYCQQRGIILDSCRFVFDGERLQNDDTPLSRDIIDGSLIDVFQEQYGGRNLM